MRPWQDEDEGASEPSKGKQAAKRREADGSTGAAGQEGPLSTEQILSFERNGHIRIGGLVKGDTLAMLRCLQTCPHHCASVEFRMQAGLLAKSGQRFSSSTATHDVCACVCVCMCMCLRNHRCRGAVDGEFERRSLEAYTQKLRVFGVPSSEIAQCETKQKVTRELKGSTHQLVRLLWAGRVAEIMSQMRLNALCLTCLMRRAHPASRQDCAKGS